MIHTLMACTQEIDDLDRAVAEIRQQLDLDKNLRKHAVGIISCHCEYVFSGAAKAICQSLPFPVTGTISTVQGQNGCAGMLLFSLMVLTSDDISFRTALTPPLHDGYADEIARSYTGAVEGGRPSLVLAFAPFVVENSGDVYVEAITGASGGAPVFGTLAIDGTADYAHCYTLYNGEHYRDRLSMVLVYGEVSPRFYMATLSAEKVLEREAVVTASDGHILQELNGRPVYEFFEEMGLAKSAETPYALSAMPFLVDLMDGTPPVMKVFIRFTEDKHALFAGAVPVGATVRVGVFDRKDVLYTTGMAVEQALEDANAASAMLAYSCASRYMTMGSRPLEEFNQVIGQVGDRAPFLVACSGGELCPTRTGDSAINRFHNNTFAICLF